MAKKNTIYSESPNVTLIIDVLKVLQNFVESFILKKGDWDSRISDLVKNPDGTYI